MLNDNLVALAAALALALETVLVGRVDDRLVPGEDPVVAGRQEQLSSVVDSAMKNDQAATLSFVVVSSSVTLIPSLNFAPASTSATSSWPLHRRQRSWAASSSL